MKSVSTASKLAGDLNLEAEAVAIGNDIENINEIGKYGIKKVIHFKNELSLQIIQPQLIQILLANYAKEISAITFMVIRILR